MYSRSDLPVLERQSIFAALRTPSFVEKAALLLLTALLSGLLVPVVSRVMEEYREKNAALSRARTKLFKEMSEILLTYETLALDASFFGTKDAKNPELQRKAFERYSERTVDLVARWRVQTARAQTLTSPKVAAMFDEFLLSSIFPQQDSPMNLMWKDCNVDCTTWDQQHLVNIKMLTLSYELVAKVATDLKLATEPPAK